MTEDSVVAQRAAMNELYSSRSKSKWAIHHSSAPLTRYLRDRRLHVAVDVLRAAGKFKPESQRVLIVCGGVGGEGTFMANQGFADVTISDLSTEALKTCERLDPRLKTRVLNAEAIDLPDNSYDLVLVQDGLHHLPRPALGLTEMLRVCRDAAIVIEPHYGLAGTLIGTTWERHGEAVNYVFRWSQQSFEQTVRSYLLNDDAGVVVRRFWDHNSKINSMVGRLPEKSRLVASQAVYAALRPMGRCGNMFVGVAFKPGGPPPSRLASH